MPTAWRWHRFFTSAGVTTTGSATRETLRTAAGVWSYRRSGHWRRGRGLPDEQARPEVRSATKRRSWVDLGLQPGVDIPPGTGRRGPITSPAPPVQLTESPGSPTCTRGISTGAAASGEIPVCPVRFWCRRASQGRGAVAARATGQLAGVERVGGGACAARASIPSPIATALAMCQRACGCQRLSGQQKLDEVLPAA